MFALGNLYMQISVPVLQERRKHWRIPRDIRTPYFITVLIMAITTFITLTTYPMLQPEIPLFYSLSDPEQQLTAKEWIFLLPVLSLIILIVNTVGLILISRVDKVMTRLAMWSTILIELLLCFNLLRILIIV